MLRVMALASPPLSIPGLSTSIFILLTSLLLYLATSFIYYVYFHPLSSYPGPALHAFTNIPSIIARAQGRSAFAWASLHAQYGPVVRVGPNDLSYATSQAWKDIYGHRAGGELAKHPREYSVKTIADQIIIADAANHARFRRSMAPAFSDRALREQEPLITKYVDMLVARLGEAAESGESTDMVGWYNCATFDLTGDLAFGEPFGCLEEGRYHPWVKMIFDSLKMVNLALCTAYFPLLNKALMNLAPASVKEMQEKHIALTKDKVKRRVDTGADRPDFLSFILRHKDESQMSYVELEANSEILIIAGGETTATALSGATYFLLKNPRVMEKLVREVRGKFREETEINSTTVGQLKYLQAVVEEALRMYPPAPINLNRITPRQGAMVCGKWVAGGTGVSVCPLAAYFSESNFRDAREFVPERWLGDPKYAKDDRETRQPFSIGSRNCIGKNLAYLELRLILARVFWNFDMVLMPESENWIDQKIYILWEKIPLYAKLTRAARP